MAQSSIGYAFEDLEKSEMAASQNASAPGNSIITYYSLTGTCFPSMVTVCPITVPITITITITAN